MTTSRDNLNRGIGRRVYEVDTMEELTTALILLSFLTAQTMPDIFMAQAGSSVFHNANS